MPNQTLTGSYGAITLTAGTTTITHTGVVYTSLASPATAVFGPPGTAWTLSNSGSINARAGLGVSLASGGMVTNTTPGLISGALGGVEIVGASGTVFNTGSIASTDKAGVSLSAGGYVSNAAAITAYTYGVEISGSAGTVVNTGVIASAYHGYAAVYLRHGGYIGNTGTGTIIGAGGVEIAGRTGTVINAGSIAATSGLEAVYLRSGGTLSNAASGVITGDDGAVEIFGGTVINAGIIATPAEAPAVELTSGTVINLARGTISAFGGVNIGLHGTLLNAGSILGRVDFSAAYMLQGGYVSNAASGVISGDGGGVRINGGSGTVINAGNIRAGSADSAVYLTNGGTVSNTGTISGYDGVSLAGATGTVVNAGRITGTGSYGVDLKAGGSVTNNASGTIAGDTGVYIHDAGATVVNAGTITGTAGVAVALDGSGDNRVVVDPGAVFNGGVTAQGTGNTLQLASAASTGMLYGLGTSFTGFGTVNVDPGATWVVSGSVTGAGTIDLGAGSDILFTGSVAPTWQVDFTTNTGTLGLADPNAFSPTVYAATPGDAFDFTTVASTGSLMAGVDATNRLTLTSNGVLQAEIQLDPSQNFRNDLFIPATDNGSGTFVIEEAALCFLRGTCIATPDGQTPVERLAVGDLVLTASGAQRPIIWIGIGQVLATRGRRNAATPVILRKDALAPNVPNHDLRVTKGHSFLLDNVLVPVEFLVNHRSILWDDHSQAVTLFHIELETHDVVLANGAPAETYRDDGNRWLFRNANTGWGAPPKPPCAPVMTGGPLVDAIWRRLLDRAGGRPGLPLTDDPDVHLVAGGLRIDAATSAQNRRSFRLPEMGRCPNVRIVSRAAVPAELGLARDARPLGVAVQRVTITQPARFRTIDASDNRLTDGFHPYEPADQVRWTNGDAALPTDFLANFASGSELILHLGGSAKYIADERGARPSRPTPFGPRSAIG